MINFEKLLISTGFFPKVSRFPVTPQRKIASWSRIAEKCNYKLPRRSRCIF